jgi:hypothetical protein
MIDLIDRLASAIGGRYELERELGRGGMATVFLARDLKHHRKVAVKVLHAELAEAVGGARFLREIEVAAGMNHPHILPLHDSGESDGILFYVMPYVEGESLEDRLRRSGQLPIAEALRIAQQVGDALAYAHSRGVIHRDITPANILLEANHAMVTDFGVAMLARDFSADRLTVSGMAPGTPIYMSPEQATGASGVDERSDIYSLGCVLYEMLSGDPPFNSTNLRAVVARKLVDPVPSLRAVRETVSVPLEKVVLKALARSPADRFQTAAEFANTLESVRVDPRVRGLEIAGGAERARPAGATAEQWPAFDPSAESYGSTPRYGLLLAISGGTLVMLTLIGFWTVVAYDAVMELPAEYTPSRLDFPILGMRAILPGAVYGLLALLAIIGTRQALRLGYFGARRVPVLRTSLDSWVDRLSVSSASLRRNVDATTAGELCFFWSVVGSGAVLSLFWRQLPGSPPGPRPSGPEILFCEYRDVHGYYTLVMAALIVVLCFAWWRVFQIPKFRTTDGARLATAKWGSGAWIVILVFLMTGPWQLLWNNQHPRALWNGERVYILLERDESMVLYNADRQVTQQFSLSELSGLERLNTVGYVFEGEDAFAGQPSRC